MQITFYLNFENSELQKITKNFEIQEYETFDRLFEIFNFLLLIKKKIDSFRRKRKIIIKRRLLEYNLYFHYFFLSSCFYSRCFLIPFSFLSILFFFSYCFFIWARNLLTIYIYILLALPFFQISYYFLPRDLFFILFIVFVVFV